MPFRHTATSAPVRYYQLIIDLCRSMVTVHRVDVDSLTILVDDFVANNDLLSLRDLLVCRTLAHCPI
jgi:hypothetical protein